MAAGHQSTRYAPASRSARSAPRAAGPPRVPMRWSTSATIRGVVARIVVGVVEPCGYGVVVIVASVHEGDDDRRVNDDHRSPKLDWARCSSVREARSAGPVNTPRARGLTRTDPRAGVAQRLADDLRLRRALSSGAPCESQVHVWLDVDTGLLHNHVWPTAQPKPDDLVANEQQPRRPAPRQPSDRTRLLYRPHRRRLAIPHSRPNHLLTRSRTLTTPACGKAVAAPRGPSLVVA